MTCPKYGHHVNGIRKSWLKSLPSNIRVLFVYGQSGRQARMEEDSLYVDCPEAYEKLPQKVHLFFEYCDNNFDYDYIFKTDDDSYIDMERFLSFDTQGADYIGRIQGMEDSAVTRTWHYGKCTDKSYEVPYSGEYIGDWARGGGYFLSRKAISILIPRTAKSFSNELFEDKMVGDALCNDDQISIVNTSYQSMGVTNPMTPSEMTNEYSKLAETEPDSTSQEGH